MSHELAEDFDDVIFFWYVTDNVGIYIKSVQEPQDIEMYIL
jgi:hypothetical protein